jgi:hypothetical protein
MIVIFFFGDKGAIAQKRKETTTPLVGEKKHP